MDKEQFHALCLRHAYIAAFAEDYVRYGKVVRTEYVLVRPDGTQQRYLRVGDHMPERIRP